MFAWWLISALCVVNPGEKPVCAALPIMRAVPKPGADFDEHQACLYLREAIYHGYPDSYILADCITAEKKPEPSVPNVPPPSFKK